MRPSILPVVSLFIPPSFAEVDTGQFDGGLLNLPLEKIGDHRLCSLLKRLTQYGRGEQQPEVRVREARIENSWTLLLDTYVFGAEFLLLVGVRFSHPTLDVQAYAETAETYELACMSLILSGIGAD